MTRGNRSPRGLRLGRRIRSLRRRQGMTQARLAEHLGISASYLALIEHDRRPVSAELLVRLARVFELDLAALAGEDDERLAADLLEVFGDPGLDSPEITRDEVLDLVSSHPAIARLVLRLYQAYRGAREAGEALASRLSDGQEHADLAAARLPSEEVTDLIQRHENHFPTLEEAAERLWVDADLDREELFGRLARHLDRRFGVRVRIEKVARMGRAVRRFDPVRRELTLSEVLRRGSRNLQLAHQIGLLSLGAELDRIASDTRLTTPASRTLCRIALANYFAAAVVMPYEVFLDDCRETRWDIELLGHRFRAGFEQVCHRLTTLKRPGREGIPFFFVRIDIAGNISKRFGTGSVRFPRFSGLCPRWNVHAAFLTPERVNVQLATMPDGGSWLMIARTLPKQGGGYRAPVAVHAVGVGCEVRWARELVYADGLDPADPAATVPVGVTCRLCEREDCAQRAFPSLRTTLQIDPNVRGQSFFAPVDPGPRGEA